MQFDVKSPEEIQYEQAARDEEYKRKYALWPKGAYPFEITAATEGISKSSGNPMITIECNVFHPEGYPRSLKDYLVASTPEKIYALCTAIGLQKNYLSGKLTAQELVGRSGTLRLGTESDDYNGEKSLRNKISGYLEPSKGVSLPPKPVAPVTAHNKAKANAYQTDYNPFEDDEVPFG